MAVEIERKFLVSDPTIIEGQHGILYKQGYIDSSGATVRVRITGDTGFLTLKGMNRGISRDEYEYAIPLQDAENMLNTLCLPTQIEKMRYRIAHDRMLWEVDVFVGCNEGLILAEVELASEDETIDIPDWIGKEVSSDPRYYNSNLIRAPYTTW